MFAEWSLENRLMQSLGTKQLELVASPTVAYLPPFDYTPQTSTHHQSLPGE